MSVEERKVYCLHDAHLVAELVRVNNGDVIKIMRVIASHTGLTFGEVCHKGMTGIWKKIIDKSISKKIGVIGYENISPVLRKLYSNKSHGNYVDYFNETEYDEEEEEDEELLEYKENSYDQYIELIEQKQRESGLNSQNINNNSKHDNSSNQRKNNVEIKKFESKYKGGLIISPSRGSHHDVFVFDITSLYPTLIINSNISPETVNCSCHENNSKAKLLFDKDSNLEFLYNKTDGGKYWTCPRNGLFSSKLEELTKVRIQYKKDDKSLESTTIKAIINSGYGVFGHSNFKYYDPSVAELVTALGRQTLLDMKKIAEEMNFTVLYGDTDSLFVNGVNNKDDALKFIETCKKKLNVFVTHEKTFRKLILVGKKHYIGIPYGNDKPVIKGMEGIKSDRPEFIHSAFIEMVKNVQEDKSPIPKLKQALKDLDKRQVPKERLAISLILSKNPKEYVNDCVQKRLGTQLKLKKGDTLVYYKCDKRITYIDQSGQERTKTVGESIDPNDISYAKYKEMLINTVKDVIEILGYSVEKDLLAKRKLW